MAVSAVVALLTIALKTAAWVITGSVGLLSDAMESFVNLASAMFGLWMVTVSERPPDEDYPFGYDKAEYFSSGFEGLLIIGAAIAIIWAAVPRLWTPQPLEQLGWGLGLSLLSSGLNWLLAAVMMRASRVHHSIALEADARHLITDVWTSAGVVVGLVLVRLTGWHWLDAVVAIGVALNILREGGLLIRRSSQGLMDAAVEPEVQAEIDAVLARFAERRGAQEVVRFDHLLTRKAGQRRFLNLHMHVPGTWSMAHSAEMRGRLEAALMAVVPGLHASIQLLPLGVEPLTTDEPVAAPGAAERLAG